MPCSLVTSKLLFFKKETFGNQSRHQQFFWCENYIFELNYFLSVHRGKLSSQPQASKALHSSSRNVKESICSRKLRNVLKNRFCVEYDLANICLIAGPSSEQIDQQIMCWTCFPAFKARPSTRMQSNSWTKLLAAVEFVSLDHLSFIKTILLQANFLKMGRCGNRTRDLSYPKRESCH